ncbi:xanthine dehydrogenase family protein molybdopterin-binding subunit [Lutibacter sp. B1]|uniref:xanthine dehydrogenase family protein molybdopterin-binding subunit n=1 Tax=Lutibacter sp. B1 TaxID=2725996 RepID=UPI0014576703|nr:molybdopterin cofactor-binding domain-containing protein [Lutibacter sp. B1]NLP57592.1 xanthine dehydrogenase family protein molybdopterin-binding subunit [Lutibacter sp. B1]
MSTIRNLSRRTFVKSIGLASGGLILACNTSIFSDKEKEEIKNLTEFNPNLFVQLNSDGSLILVASRSEMGNGVRTSLPSVIADEMEADWKMVKIQQAVGDKKYGDQNTDGSRSIRYLYETMRQMGATVKAMLITAAAQTWNVPESECVAENHFIVHTSGKKIGFGDLVEKAKTLEVPTEVALKSPKDFKYIGKHLRSVDAENYVNGSAVFGLDKRLPNMKFVAIERCPVTFGTVKSFDKTEALKVAGVEAVIEIPRITKPFGALGGVAVIASNTWAAFKGKEALKIAWDFGDNKSYNSSEFMDSMTKNVHKQGKVAKDIGSISKAFKNADKIIESTYQLPHLAHTPMEVPNAVAWVQGETCEVWAPTQAPQRSREEVASYLNTSTDNVTINVTLLGGGFGRKSKPDYIVEAAIISKEVNAPVQVVWTREDDVKHDYFHTVSAQYMKASLDKNGNVTGWLHRFALPSITSTFQPGVDYAAGWEISSASNVPFDIKNMKIEVGQAPAHVRIGWLRSVINIPHGYSINVFADELAAAANKDPLEFRLNLIGEDRIEETEDPIKYNTARLKNVLKIAAKNAEWGKELPEGHAYGLAVHYSFYSYVASVVEVSVINNKVKVHNVYTAIDCGTVVNKDTVKAQMEGSAVFGMSLAYYGKITAKEGAIEQSNFNDFKMIRIHEAPNVHVEIVESTERPTGVGEPGVPVIAPAIINAIYKATGKRYYNLPLSDYGLV